MLPSGLKNNEEFPFLLVTPTTKAVIGHDEDISSKEIVEYGLATEDEWNFIEKKAKALFKKGQEIANKLGLILVDTKYEFGKTQDGTIYLIDEVHTPDSSRYWYLNTYDECFLGGKEPKALSKEFVREWLAEHDYRGREEDQMPDFSEEFINDISARYLELYEAMGSPYSDIMNNDAADVYEVVSAYLHNYGYVK
jgi:phosphoribosylaminoimidazole-succinocarboxamide synthase